MNRQMRRKAFTLIELLTVMAIITLLIGILTPAVGAARDRARTTAVRAQINAMEVGLESFASDDGKYPASNAVLYASDINNTAGTLAEEMNNWEVGTLASPLQGAHLLVDALVGRDFLGFDPKAQPAGPVPGGGTGYDRWNPNNDRRQPYMPLDGVDVTSVTEPPEDAFGRVPDTQLSGGNILVQPTIEGPNPGTGGTPLLCRIFRDKFGWPVLYFRAARTSNQNTPIITANNTTPPPNANYGNGVYDGLDNEAFTSHSQQNCPPQGAQPNNQSHRICDAYRPMDVAPPATGYGERLPNQFAEYIRSIRSSTYLPPPNDRVISRPRPVKADRFIILSAGKNGVYGDLDDVANFQVLSTER